MKSLLLLFSTFIFSFNPISSHKENVAIHLCNAKVTSVSITGNVDFTDEIIDFDDACITFSGSIGVCNDEGEEITSINFTAHSDGCDDPRPASDDPQYSLETIEALLNLGYDGGEKDLTSSIPLAYPNPSSTNFTLTNVEPGYKIQLIDSKTGEIKRTFVVGSDGLDIIIETNGLPSGTYYIKTVSEDLQTDYTQTVIIE